MAKSTETSSSFRGVSQRICAALPLLVITGFLGGCSDPETAAPPGPPGGRTRSFELSITDRAVAQGGDTIRVTQGERVELRWTTDEATSIHLHGYDIEAALEPKRPFTMTFDAEVSGRFPVTTHGFEGRSDAGHSHEQEHEHSEHHPDDQASAQSAHSEKTLLYLEVHPR